MKVIKNKKYAYFSIAALLAGTLAFIFPPHIAPSNAQDYTATGTDPATGEWVWQVNVQEVLNMTITNEGGKVSATGDVDQFLRDKVTVNVSSNNGTGFTAGMTTLKDTTELSHATLSTSLPTLQATAKCGGTSDANCAQFAANHWGYSLDDTDAGKAGTYAALVGAKQTPITIASSATQASASKDVFFGAKANQSQASGTYKGTVVFTVTSGTKGSDLPAASGTSGDPTPGEDFQPSISPSTNSVPTYTYTTNNRTYRSTATSIADATVSTDAGQTKRSTANDFVSPLGVNQKEDQTFSNIQHGSIITTTLMVVAIIAAGVGIFFFILARRRDREEEDEIQEV